MEGIKTWIKDEMNQLIAMKNRSSQTTAQLSLELYRDGLEPFRRVLAEQNTGTQLWVNKGSYYNYLVAGTGKALADISEATIKYQDWDRVWDLHHIINTGREQSGEGRIVNKMLFYKKYFIVIQILVLIIITILKSVDKLIVDMLHACQF